MAAVTLGNVIRERKLMLAYCNACGHDRDVDLATVPLPETFPVPDVGTHEVPVLWRKDRDDCTGASSGRGHAVSTPLSVKRRRRSCCTPRDASASMASQQIDHYARTCQVHRNCFRKSIVAIMGREVYSEQD